MSKTIKKLTIRGYKSIRRLDFKLCSLNVLIGANGAGKSNFVGFFRLLKELIDQRLQIFVPTVEGGADACLYIGPMIPPRCFIAKVDFGKCQYEFALVPTADSRRLVFNHEAFRLPEDSLESGEVLGPGHSEAKLKNLIDDPRWRKQNDSLQDMYEALSRLVVYHFNDTSLSAGFRRLQQINDNEMLRHNADNVAAFLHRIQQTDRQSYNQIRDVVRLAAPFFDDFKLRPVPTSPNLIQLEWRQWNSDYPFLAHQLSDGTLRFICLATALLQPFRPPIMLFDEPELGLHPYALTLLGNLFKQAANHPDQQIIISTQSAPLLNEFAPEDVVVVERHQGESTFRRLASADLSVWLEEYALGELWQKNVLGGRPGPENAPQLIPDGDDHL
jgi:predicted ATPase